MGEMPLCSPQYMSAFRAASVLEQARPDWIAAARMRVSVVPSSKVSRETGRFFWRARMRFYFVLLLYMGGDSCQKNFRRRSARL